MNNTARSVFQTIQPVAFIDRKVSQVNLDPFTCIFAFEVYLTFVVEAIIENSHFPKTQKFVFYLFLIIIKRTVFRLYALYQLSN